MKIWTFAVILHNFGGNLRFLNTKNAVLMTTASVFITSEYVITIWYSHLIVLISELTQCKSALNQRWSSNFSDQRKSALISHDSELILSESVLFSADVFQVLWISAEKREISETALFNADYLWDFNPGNIVLLLKLLFWQSFLCSSVQLYFRIGMLLSWDSIIGKELQQRFH